MFERRYTYTIFAPPFPFSIILYLYTERGTLFPAPYLSRHFLSAHLFTLLLYTLYIEEHTFPQLFTPFLYFYYTPIIYRRGNILPAPFLPLYILL